MDLLQTVRKEGSRGGVNFSWDDVKGSARREAYLGHSIMAPVGRWQQNKDLSWYAKAEDAELTAEQRAAKEQEAKREELRKVKQAEEDAMAKALGLPVPERKSDANETPLGMDRLKQAEVNQALKEALKEDDGEKGIGYDGQDGSKRNKIKDSEDERKRDRRTEHRDSEDHRSSKRRHRSRSPSRDRSRSRDDRRRRRHRNDQPRSRSKENRRRVRSPDRRTSDDHHRRRKDYDDRSHSREREYRRHRNRSRSRSRSPPRERRRRRDRSR